MANGLIHLKYVEVIPYHFLVSERLLMACKNQPEMLFVSSIMPGEAILAWQMANGLADGVKVIPYHLLGPERLLMASNNQPGKAFFVQFHVVIFRVSSLSITLRNMESGVLGGVA